MPKRVLLIEDDDAMRKSIAQSLDIENIEVIEACDYTDAALHIRRDFQGIVLSDIRLPGKDGFDVLALSQSKDTELPVILLTGEGDIPMAVKAMKMGASDFLEKPIHPDTLTRTLQKWIYTRELTLRNRYLEEQLRGADAAASSFPGNSSASETIRTKIRELSQLPVDIHLQGPEGSGKSLAARAIHDLSRKQFGYLTTDASALTAETLAEELDQIKRGTLVICSIELANLEQQALLQKLLDMDKKTRVITTSHSTLDELMKGGLSRNLYFSLSVVTYNLPTLNERKEDVIELFQHYVSHYAKTLNRATPVVTADIRAKLAARDWHGNLKELQTIAQRFILGFEIGKRKFEKPDLNQHIMAYERLLIVESLQIHLGSTHNVAEELGVPLPTLYDKLRKHGLRPRDYKIKPSGVISK